MRLLGLLCALALPVFGQYSATRDGDVVRLEDTQRQTVVSVMPAHGMYAFDMKVKGKNALYFPAGTAEAFKRGRGMNGGVPFLAPWANRLDEPAFYANGKKYSFNTELGNVRPDRNGISTHGFLTTAAEWEVTEVKADAKAAWVTAKLEFYRQPDWMAQFPFAHTIEMTYRLQDGALEVITTLHNLSAAPMPVALGFHPYFQVNDAPRNEWTISIGARTHWEITKLNIPTGETRPIGEFLPGQPQGSQLNDIKLDDLFTDLIRDSNGRATMSVQGKNEKVEVIFGPNYRAAVVWAPSVTQKFICFEPMAGITDSMNLAQRGVYKELQSVAPGGTWKESFWVKPSGF
jgi:aldose 1-epimerase